MGAIAIASTILAGCGNSPGTFKVGRGDQYDLAAGLAADEPRAVLVGRDVLAAGGTAADAATAMGLAMGVTLPARAGLGGGGVCIVHDPGRKEVRTLDFLPRAPEQGSTVAVPAMLRGFAALQAGYGRLRWEQIVAPVEALARENRSVSRAAALDLGDFAAVLQDDPEARRIFVEPLGHPPDEAEPLAQHDLAGLLAQVRQRGAGVLYSGPLAARVAAATGLATETLGAYQPEWRGTVDAPMGDAVLHFAALPEGQPAHAAWQQVRAEGADRAARVGAALRPALPDAPPTAGLVAFDDDGQSVACTLSMGGPFGTGRMVPGTGLFLARPAGAAGIAGPAILANRNVEKGLLVLSGSAGLPEEGPGAAGAALVTTAAALLDQRAAPDQALRAVRMAPGPEGGVLVERAMPATVAASLGSPAQVVPFLGRAHMVSCRVREDDGARKCEAATDPRGFGLALTGN